jgi:hypothetical protein
MECRKVAGIVELLASLPPAAWKETLRRLEVLRSFKSIQAPTRSDVEDHAARLGIDVRTYYRLIRAQDELKRGAPIRKSRRGTRRFLPPETERIIDEVLAELGHEIPDRIILIEVARRCREASLPAPSAGALRTRSAPARVDLRIRLRRRFDVILDACPCDLDVLSEDGAAPAVAWFAALLRGSDGSMIAHAVTAGSPTATQAAALVELAGRHQDPDGVLVATGDLQGTTSLADTARPHGLRFDAAASMGLRPGAALMPVMGLKLGRLSFQARRRTIHDKDVAVPLEIARDVVDHLLASRSA